MARRPRARHLATLLFIDIVGSTRIATALGDIRWKDTLNDFRAIVRRQLASHRGHEEDTTGDGFFATFTEPAAGVAAAAAIAGAVQELGLDVRAGIHFGECELIDGSLGGVAVHIAARVK
jgi:class 3 adenylate cyclase